MFIRIDPERWHPDVRLNFETSSGLKPQQLVVWERRPYRVVEVRPRQRVDWGEDYITAWLEAGMPEPDEWWARPMMVVVRDEDQPKAKPLHLCAPANTMWHVLPEHFPVCRLCHEIPPCQHVMNERLMADAEARFARDMAIMPGCCHACREPITGRQKTTTFPGANLMRPDFGDNSAIFHTRGKCRDALERYDKRWADTTGNRRRWYCEGRQTVHTDKSLTCTELTDCPGDVDHRSRDWHNARYQGVGEACWCLAGETQAGQLTLGEGST